MRIASQPKIDWSGLADVRAAVKDLRMSGGFAKDDVTSLQSQTEAAGFAVNSTQVQTLLDSFDQFDADANGKLNNKELRAYASQSGLSSLRQVLDLSGSSTPRVDTTA